VCVCTREEGSQPLHEVCAAQMREERYLGGGWYGVHDSVSGYRSKEMAVCECCHHTALGPGCSPTVLTYLPSHPGHSGFCALSVSGTLPPTWKHPMGHEWEGVGRPRGRSSSHTQGARGGPAILSSPGDHGAWCLGLPPCLPV
jgi:hypothetical protein